MTRGPHIHDNMHLTDAGTLYMCLVVDAAYVEMGGRFFGGRQIQTSFFDEDKFNARDLVPSRE